MSSRDMNAMRIKEDNGTGPMCLEIYILGVRPVLARMPENTVCDSGVTDVKRI